MIKISKFEPNKDILKQKFDEQMDQLIKKMPLTQNGVLSSFESMLARERLTATNFTDYCRNSIENSQTEEIWLNPSEIAKIEVKTVLNTEEKFLKIYMHNGDIYHANGESVQEFFLKNVIFGNDV